MRFVGFDTRFPNLCQYAIVTTTLSCIVYELRRVIGRNLRIFHTQCPDLQFGSVQFALKVLIVLRS